VRLAKTTAQKEGQMLVHRNAKLGLAGRLALVEAIEAGLTLKAAAAAFRVSPATAHRWWHRWLEGGRSVQALLDRSSRPRRSPRRTPAVVEQRLVQARRETGYGPGRLAGIVRVAPSTVWKVLRRHGCSRSPRLERPATRRYEWSRPGALLHVDVKKLARFREPGHRVSGDRREISSNRGVGYDYLHCVLDDNSRFVHVELHPREDGKTAARVLERALAELAELGLDPPEAVMSDNAFAYRLSSDFQGLLAAVGARHITTPPYTPRWNGKVERFIQTLQREWAYARTWPNSSQRARALPSYVRYYNRRRPHSSLGGRPPISRVHNLRGSDI
jgi:transposase InsO family protein